MKVLVACEFSGVVRRAFASLGHEAWSCDLLPAEDNSPMHIQGDVLDVIYGAHEGDAPGDFDLMIAHPPCTRLAVSGARWWKDHMNEVAAAEEFFTDLWDAPINRICIENPVGRMSRYFKPAQYIQPWQFGHPESKKTGLWLKNLPLLHPTEILDLPESGRWNNQTPSGQNKLGPSEDRWKLRSITYQGIANAMATQWGTL